jgi:hypothetical protein
MTVTVHIPVITQVDQGTEAGKTDEAGKAGTPPVVPTAEGNGADGFSHPAHSVYQRTREDRETSFPA